MNKFIYIIQDEDKTIKGVFANQLKAKRYIHLARIRGKKFTCERWEVYNA